MRLSLAVPFCLLAAANAHADEGMWLFNDFPTATVKKALGSAPDDKWLEKVRLGSVRLAGGCSASFVSSTGLVMTNHHCVRGCLEDLSSPERDLLDKGFFAATAAAEEKCPKVEANQLVAMTDVTAQVLAATQGAEGADYKAKLKVISAKLESECAKGDDKTRCDVVTLFNGAKFHLYQYRRFQDVRMVFAPESDAAAFGGDPDNFNFPRYAFDVAFLRVYENGAPRPTPERLKWSPTPVKENDPVYVSGHPGGTERALTVAQLAFQRDVGLPWALLRLAELRGRLSEWMKQSPERTRVGESKLRPIENALKALRGRHQAVGAKGFIENRQAEEQKLQAAAPAASKGAWDAIANATDTRRKLWAEFRMKEGGEAFVSELFTHARRLARYAVEKEKPNGERLPEFTDGQLPQVRLLTLGKAPISKELEKVMLTWSLTRMQELFGADDPFVRNVLGKKSPAALAAELVDGTRLDNADFRKEVLERQGKVEESDPMMAFAKKVDAASREIRKRMEDEVDAVVKKNSELLADARRAVYGTTGYPDATFTLRLSYGQVKGFGNVKPFTKVSGLYERATDYEPFALAPSWAKAKSKLKPDTAFNYTSTHDIIGGNSGSPMVNKHADVVGLIFDGNLASLAGNFGYDGRENRAVAVHADIITEGLAQVYGAKRIVDELKAP